MRRHLLCLSLLCWLPTLSWALPGDRDLPIKLTSELSKWDLNEGVYIYTGNVEIRQGTLLIRADRLLVRNQNNAIHYLQAIGEDNLAYFEDQQQPGEDIIQLWGKEIQYFAQPERVLSQGDARLKQGINQLEAKEIDYLVDSGEVNAKGDVRTQLINPGSN